MSDKQAGKGRLASVRRMRLLHQALGALAPLWREVCFIIVGKMDRILLIEIKKKSFFSKIRKKTV